MWVVQVDVDGCFRLSAILINSKNFIIDSIFTSENFDKGLIWHGFFG